MPRQHTRSRVEFLYVSICAALAGCASDPVSLDARAPLQPAAQKVARPVAFLHTKAFRDDVQTIEPYGNKYYMPLKTGEASDRVLRATYAQIFAAPRVVASAADLAESGSAHAPVALIEPSIVKFDYVNASARGWGPFFAEITYSFSLADAAGAPLASWRVRGIGRYDPSVDKQEPLPRSETAMLAEAPRLAINAAAIEFVHSFERVPELIRLSRDMPLAGANVPAERQTTREGAPAGAGVEAAYAGAFELQVQRAVLPRPPPEIVTEVPQEPYLLPVRLTLHNRSAHRLALYPADAEWLPAGQAAGAQQPLSPLPGPVVSAFLAGQPFGLMVGVMSPGTGMLPGLFAAIVNLAELSRQKKEFTAWSAAIDRELLAAGVTAPAASRSGLVFFPRPSRLDGGSLLIQVIDLDDALRYSVRVPLPAQ